MAKLFIRIAILGLLAGGLQACGGKMDPMQFGGDGAGDIKN